MAISVRPKKDGGRSVILDTPYLLLHAEISKDGVLHVEKQEIREPEPPLTASAGLGDTIAKITKAVGIKPCGGCKKRQDKLNKLVPYK